MADTDSWKDPQFAATYMENAMNVDTNWYEHSVNVPSLWALVPKGTKSILDFGCGPGDFTAQLRERGYEADGCDGSGAMIELARMNCPGVNFFVWDGATRPPSPKTYDAILTKLALHFVENLNTLAGNLSLVLNSGGSLLVSVPHPIPTIPKVGGAYFEETYYDTEIGSYGMRVTMIHRSIQDYIDPFLDNGYVMTGVAEPVIPDEIRKKYDVKKEYAVLPRRLNLRFRKP